MRRQARRPRRCSMSIGTASPASINSMPEKPSSPTPPSSLRPAFRNTRLTGRSGEVVPGFHKGRLAIAQAKQEVAARRAKLTPPTVDKSDAAGALRRQEIRALVRSLDQKVEIIS